MIQYVNDRDALLERIVLRLTEDSRVEAAWLSGSFGRGEADDWSDFDIPRPGRTIEPRGALDVIEALCTEVQRLHPGLSTRGTVIPHEMPAEVARMQVLAEDAVDRITLPPHKRR